MSQPYYPQQPQQPYYPPPGYQPPPAAPRARLVVPAWLGVSFGIAGVVGIPVIFLNNLTALLAVVGLICAVIALFGSRKLLAVLGLVLCLGGFVGTLAIQAHWSNELDRIQEEISTP